MRSNPSSLLVTRVPSLEDVLPVLAVLILGTMTG
jgi:hypothetical protein